MTVSQSAKPAKRSWTTRMVGIMLLVQALLAGLLYPVLATLQVWRTPGLRGRPIAPLGELFALDRLTSFALDQLPLELAVQDRVVQVQPGVLASRFLLLVSVPLLLVGVLFLLSWRPAWGGAILLQAAILVLALAIRFRYRPIYAYPLMLYGIVVVLYLNHFEVRQAFLSPSAPPLPAGEREGGAR